MQPLTAAVAGQETIVNVNVVMTFALSVSVALAVTGVRHFFTVRSYRRMMARNRKLEIELVELRTRLEVSQSRKSELNEDLARLRGDLAMLKGLLEDARRSTAIPEGRSVG
jgi:hypothetical protein